MVAYSLEKLQEEYDKYISDRILKGCLLEFDHKEANIIYLRKRLI